MSLSPYHQKYSALPDEELQKRIQEKKDELAAVLQVVHPALIGSGDMRVAILGCGDKRLVDAHRTLFSEALQRPVILTTFDISTEHLSGEEGVVEHDCTVPLPGGPYTITYGHVLLKFIQTEKQWNVIRNSIDALEPGGIAIHVLDSEEMTSTEPVLPSGQFAVPLPRWLVELDALGYRHWEVPVRYGLALVVQR